MLAFSPDWGTVPAWFGGLSLVLALIIFMKDRSAGERKDVDLVGAWWETNWEIRTPTDETGRVETGTVKVHFGNSGNLPIEIVQVAAEVRTRWLVRDLDQWDYEPDGRPRSRSWTIKSGTESQQYFMSNVRVPPQEKIERDFPIDVGHMAPEHADQLSLEDGITCKILWMLIVDNVGRRWEVCPGVGRRARRIRWYSRRHEFQPHQW